MAGLARKVHLTYRISDYSFLLEYSKEVPTAGIITDTTWIKVKGEGLDG